MPALVGTSKNSALVFTPYLDPSGSILLTGFANENIIAVPDVEIVKSTMGNDGIRQVAVVAKQIEGSFVFWANSPSLEAIYNLQNGVYLDGIPVQGVLSVVFPSLVKSFSYSDFTFMSAPKGYEAADEVKPQTIKWSSLIPAKSSFGAAVSLVASLL